MKTERYKTYSVWKRHPWRNKDKLVMEIKMIKLRNMACAFLSNGDNFLLMKRSSSMKIYPNFWAPVGGHIEQSEINDPILTCLREIYEGTGLNDNDISSISLRYITIRRRIDEIRIQYVYFGTSIRNEVSHCDEGELFWVNQNKILNLEMSFVNNQVISHYFQLGKHNSLVYVGVVSGENNKPEVSFSTLKDLDALL